MKILATFDGSSMSESALGLIEKVARGSDEVILLSVVERTRGGVRMRGPLRPNVGMATFPSSEPFIAEPETVVALEVKSQRIEREVGNRRDYLQDLGGRLPHALTYSCEVSVHDDPACAIIERALTLHPDLIIMTTHGHTGLVHILFGDVAEEVVRSGVAPVLLVHPENVRSARKAGPSAPSHAGR